jgi:hypothetical protein
MLSLLCLTEPYYAARARQKTGKSKETGGVFAKRGARDRRNFSLVQSRAGRFSRSQNERTLS